MRSILQPRPLGALSTRRITLFVLAIIMVLFSAITAHSAYAQQADSQQVTGNEATITYSGETYKKLDPIPKSDPTFESSACGAPTITAAYIHLVRDKDTSPAKGAKVVCSKDFTTGDAVYVSFPNAKAPAGSDQVSTFGDITPSERDDIVAIQKRYDLKGLPSGGVSDSLIKDPSVNLPAVTQNKAAYEALYKKFNDNVQSEGPIKFGTAAASSVTTCDSKFTHGLGWVICPVTNWLAAGMDQIYNILQGFLTVTPLSTDKSSPLYFIWDMVRNLANILFILGFLAIIYSQITSVGLSSYGIKRLLPRLIIAVVLVNISYWIVAVAVDLSNILGVAIKDLFDQVIDSIPKNPNNPDIDWHSISWEAIAGAALSGAAALFGISSVAIGLVVSAGASLWFLLVALAGVLVSALVAILILAARQAIITIFIIISPLAFVAYLLPGTEKYFHRWREVFMTMLLVFPIFSFVFGGAHLAGIAIIYTADPKSANFLNLIILGMIVQVAPVVITPLLIRVSGALLGRFAGFVNNPNKGIIDNTRKFAQNRHDRTKNRRLWAWDKNDPTRRASIDPLAWGGRKIALRNLNHERELKAWEGGIEAAYAQDHRSHEVHRQHELNEMRKSTGESLSKAGFNEQVATNDLLRRLYYSQQQSNEKAEAATKNISTQWQGLKADPNAVGVNAAERLIGDQANEVDRRTRALGSREGTAKLAQEKAYDAAIRDNANTELREFAGFNQIDPHGVARVVNLAQEAGAKSYAALVEAGQRALQREEATLDELEEIIENGTSSNPKFAHFNNDIESRAAAIRQYMDTAPMRLRHEMVARLDMSANAMKGTDQGIMRSEVAAALRKNKPFFISQTFLNQMAEGDLSPSFNGVPGRNRMVLDTLNKFGFDEDAMVSMDQDDVGAVADFFNSPEAAGLDPRARQQIIESLEKAFDKNDRYAGRMGKRRTNLNRVRNSLGMNQIWE